MIGDDLDDIHGILHAKDLLRLAIERDGEFDIKDWIRPAAVIPESKRVNILLQDFRSTRNHMAVVVDEYGHVCGVVTIEDVLEQIVGDIEDEHDVDDESYIKMIDEHTYNVKATTTVEDFNDYFDAEFDEEEFDTIGGIVLKTFGHLPQRGETTIIDGCASRFECGFTTGPAAASHGALIQSHARGGCRCLLPLAFAPFDLWPLALVSVALWFHLLDRDPGRGLLLGWLYGVGKYAVGVSWVYVSIHEYGNAPPVLAGLLVALFVVGLALFTTANAWLFVWVRNRSPGADGNAPASALPRTGPLLPGSWCCSSVSTGC